jgi:hypothetical protein
VSFFLIKQKQKNIDLLKDRLENLFVRLFRQVGFILLQMNNDGPMRQEINKLMNETKSMNMNEQNRTELKNSLVKIFFP